MNYKTYSFNTSWIYTECDIYKIKAQVCSSTKEKAWSILSNKLIDIKLQYMDVFYKGIRNTGYLFKSISINNFKIEEYEMMEIDTTKVEEVNNKDSILTLKIYEGYSGIGGFELKKYEFNGVKEKWFHDDKHNYYTDIWYPSRYKK